jgi:hypothetical protein
MHSSRPEHELLFYVGRRELDRESFRQLVNQVRDWEFLLNAANTHGLIPLLQKHVHSLAADLTPVGALSSLKQQSVANTQNVLHLMSRQLKLFRLFKENQIPVAIFKGSVLSQMVYGEPTLRHAGDIDVLISRAHFSRAKSLLESLGYEMAPSLSDAQLASHRRSHCEIQFVRDDWFTVIDLHWAFAPKNFVFKLEADDVLSRLQRVEVAGTEIETLATEDLILYLSMHGAKHLWRALEWITSLGELIRSAESIDWDVVVERAVQAHATGMLALGLRLIETISQIEIPIRVFSSVDPDASAKKLAHQVLVNIFSLSSAQLSTETNLHNFKIMDRKRDALVCALRAVFVPTLTDWHSLALPPSLHSLYYAYRPLRLSKVYTASVWRKLSSRGAACL